MTVTSNSYAARWEGGLRTVKTMAGAHAFGKRLWRQAGQALGRV